MTTGWVWAWFFDTQTRPASPLLLPGLGPFNKRVFFLAPNPARQVSMGPVGPFQPLLGLFRDSPIQPNFIKKKKNTQTQT